MIKIENTEVHGFEAAIRAIKMLDPDYVSDSYKTHIENPQTMNTADFQFVMGEKDFAKLKKLVICENINITKYINGAVDITADDGFWDELEHLCGGKALYRPYSVGCFSYAELREMYVDIAFSTTRNPDIKTFIEWIHDLPYSGLITG